MRHGAFPPGQRGTQSSIPAHTMGDTLAHTHNHQIFEYRHESIGFPIVGKGDVLVLVGVIAGDQLYDQRMLLVPRGIDVMLRKVTFFQQVSHGIVVIAGYVNGRIGMQLGRAIDGVGGPLGDLVFVLFEREGVFVDAADGVFDAEVYGGVLVGGEVEGVHGGVDAGG